ncbi:putative iron-dependent peroxidase [Knoellia remsis]|uniref:Putative iron-dependent peroxidase n=1 Tax=Knoellia remsis TaxID=407159 RepID=A0A2T0U7X4_9MICO|nr:Dyp-type peroxidase [Knoellia remsis]PRY54017.1 putative iron-dependent peroxidase [Knoellia remsis]
MSDVAGQSGSAPDAARVARPGTDPQAVLTPLTPSAMFLVIRVRDGGEDGIRETLGAVNDLRKSVGFRIPEGQLTCVVGIGSDLWDRIFTGPRPAKLHPFEQLDGPRHTAPSTPGDVLLHIRAQRMDLCFELAQLIVGRLGDAGEVVDEVHGFRSFDERDLLGFVDGTANPEGAAAADSVIVGDEDRDFAGGSYVITQKYVHDLAAWDALTVEEQERAIGRTKLDDVEFPDDEKAPDSHVTLNTIHDEDGNERDIMRFNMPFGRVGSAEFGTFFIGYARDPGVTEQMLQHMFLGNPPGTTDRILDFSTAQTGCLFFVPTLDFLDDLPDAP